MFRSKQACIVILCGMIIILMVLVNSFMLRPKQNPPPKTTLAVVILAVIVLVFVQLFIVNCLVFREFNGIAWGLVIFVLITTFTYIGVYLYVYIHGINPKEKQQIDNISGIKQ